MKKIIAVILAAAVICAGGWLLYSQVLTNPERLILGDWECTSDNGIEGVAGFEGYEFLEEGKVIVKAKMLADVKYEGKYTIDKENETLTITYEVLGFSYDAEYKYSFDGDNLSLTGAESSLVANFVKKADK